MFFRNVTFFRFPTSLSTNDLVTGADECRLKPVGPLELSSRGFVSPYGRDSAQLIANSGRVVWLAIGGEDRILPAAAVNDALARKLDEIEQREGRRPGGRTRKRLKDELVAEMLPRAFVRPSRTDVLIDLDRGVVAVDTTSRRAAEKAVSEIRRALGSFPALPLNAEVAPRAVLTGWVAGEALPDGLSIGDDCELRDPIDHGGVVKVQRMDLHGDEITRHLESGKQATRLALCMDDHVSFTFGDDLVIRKFRLLDGALDALESTEGDDIRAELDARLALMVGELGRLFDLLEPAFRISKVEG